MSKPRKPHVRKARRLLKRPMGRVLSSHGRTKPTLSHAYGSGADAPRGARLVAQFIDDTGLVVVNDVADWFGMSKGQLAETVGIRPETLQRVSRVGAPKTQSRVKEMLEIIGRVADWAGGKDQAMAWYRAEPIPAFGGRPRLL